MNERWDIRKHSLFSQVINGTTSLNANEIITENIDSMSNINNNNYLGSLKILSEFELESLSQFVQSEA